MARKDDLEKSIAESDQIIREYEVQVCPFVAVVGPSECGKPMLLQSKSWICRMKRCR